jgi:molybdenum cofactor cytidylyltransferase
MPTLRILLPAAGAASRMRGGDKLLEKVDGLALLRRQAGFAAQVCGDVVVTLRVDDAARRAVLQGLAIRAIEVTDASEGMAASIRAGVAGALGAVMVLPSDMPEIDAADLRVLIDAFDQAPEAIWRGASAKGVAGHPVVFPADLVADLRGISGDAGAREVIRRHAARVRLCPLPAAHALTDLDTPEDWQAWRALRR